MFDAFITGKSISECLALYFRLKSKVFKGNRPYDSNALEEFLKLELGGDEMKLTDLNCVPKVSLFRLYYLFERKLTECSIRLW